MKSHRARGLPLGGESTFPSDSWRRAVQRPVCLKGEGEKGLFIYGFSMKYKAKSSAASVKAEGRYGRLEGKGDKIK